MEQQSYIIDASALIQAFIQDTDSAHAKVLLHRAINDPTLTLHVPEFCLLECTNILWKQMAFHGSPRTSVQALLSALLAAPLTVYQARNYLPRTLAIAMDYHLATYDSAYLALAEVVKFPLITADGRQGGIAGQLGIALKPLNDF